MGKELSPFQIWVRKMISSLIPFGSCRRRVRDKWLGRKGASPAGEDVYVEKGWASFPCRLNPCLAVRRANAPLVSVLVDASSCPDGGRELVESVFLQSYANWEMVLLAGSADVEVRSLAEDFAEKTGKRIVIRDSVAGDGAGKLMSWAECLPLLKGELVWVIDERGGGGDLFLEQLVPFFSVETVALAFACEGAGDNKEGECILFPASEWSRQGSPAEEGISCMGQALFRKKRVGRSAGEGKYREIRTLLTLIRGGFCVCSAGSVSVFHSTHAAQELGIRHKARRMRNGLPFLSRRSRGKMKIMVGSAGFSLGGGEIFPVYLANALRDRGNDVTLLNFCGVRETPGIRTLLREDIPLVELDPLREYGSADLKELILSLKSDIVHTHYLDADYALAEVRELTDGFRLVSTLHGMYEAVSPRFWKRRGYSLKKLADHVDGFVYIADKGRRFFSDRGMRTDHFTKILNGLPLMPLSPVDRGGLGIPEDAFVICLASRAIQGKGWKEAVEIVRLARKKSSRPIHLLMLGTGPVHDELERDMDAATRAYVHLLGFKSNPRDYFSASDAGILPTNYPGESCPLVLIDCLLSGKPFLVTDMGETASQLETGQGEPAGAVIPLVQGNPDIAAFAECLAGWAEGKEDYALACGRVGAAAEKANIVYVAFLYEKLFREIIKNNFC